MTPSEIYSFEFQRSEPKHYTMVANIIDHLTYSKKNKDGTTTSVRLSVYAKELYRIIRMIANDKGRCWNTTKNLALKMNCSTGTVCNAKKELLMPMDQLEGNALIVEKRDPISKIENGKTTSSRVLCKYTVVDIWRWNNAFMATLKYHNQMFGRNSTDAIPVVDQEKYESTADYYEKTDSCDESVSPTDSCDESVSLGTDSCGEPNKIQKKKNPLSKEQQPTATPIVVSSNAKERLFPSDDKKKIYDYLVKEGCHEVTAHKIATIYSLDEFQKAIAYTNTMNKKAQKANRWGYLQSVLKNKYWESKNA